MRRTMVFASCLAFACSEAPTYVLLQVPPDPADAGVVVPPDASVPPRRDGGVVDTGVVDAGPLPPHDRELTTYRLFGETPIENLVMNPMLDLHTTLNFFAPNSFFIRHHFPASPSGLPAMELSSDGIAIIPVQSRPVPLDISIWAGRRDGAPLGATVLLTGIDRSGANQMATLIRDRASRIELEDIVWERFTGTLSATLLGQVQLVVNNAGSSASLFATGPVVVPSQSNLRGPSFPSIGLQPIDEGLRENLAIAYAHAKEQAKRSIGKRAPLTGMPKR